MSNSEEIQELKREKKWDELIDLFKELSDKGKKSTAIIRAYIDACENTGKFDEDYFTYLDYLINKSEKQSPLVKKLMDYYEGKDEIKYKKYYFKYLKSLAHEKSYGKLEENILEALENKKLSNDEIYEIAVIISKKGNKELASSIINLVINDIDMKDEIYYKFLKLLLDTDPNDKNIKMLFIDYYKNIYKEHKNLDKLLKISKLMICDSLKKAVKVFEDLILFDEDEYVYHQNFGTGKIEKVDYIFDDVKIRFKNNTVKKFKRQKLNNIVVHLDKNDYNVYRFDRIDDFKNLIKESPDKAVYVILKKANKKLSQKELKSFFVPYFIDEKDWLNEWKRIKKACEKSPIITKDLSYNYAINKGGGKSIVDEILKITDLKRRLFELEKIQNDLDEEEKKQIESSFKTIPNLRAFFFLKKIFPDKYDLENFLREQVAAKERLNGYMNDIVRAKYIYETFKIAENIWEGFDDFMEISISQFSPFVQEQYIEYLYKNDKKDLAEKIIKDTLDDIYLHPDLFLIVVKNKLKGAWGGEEDIGIERLFEKLFELYEYISIEANNEQDKEAKQLYQQLMQKTRDLIRSNNFAFFKKAVSSIGNENRARMLIRQIDRIENLPVEMQVTLKGIVNEEFPDIEKEKEIEIEKKIDKKKREEGALDTFFTLKSTYNEKIKLRKHILGVEIPENSKRISEAVAMGDLSENAEYKAAKEKQRMLSHKMKVLEDEINNAIVKDLDDIKGDFVTFGTEVKLKDKKGEEFVYKVLGPWESNIEKNIISYNSDIGEALEGKKTGEKIKLRDDEYTILSVKKLENCQ